MSVRSGVSPTRNGAFGHLIITDCPAPRTASARGRHSVNTINAAGFLEHIQCVSSLCMNSLSCMCRHVHIHAYIHIHTHTHMHAYTYIYIYVHAYTCRHICTHICTYIQIHMHIYMHMHAYTHTYMHACAHICIYTHIYMHAYTYVHMHTCTYIHIERQTEQEREALCSISTSDSPGGYISVCLIPCALKMVSNSRSYSSSPEICLNSASYSIF